MCVAAVALLPFLALIVTRAGSDYVPAQDIALIHLRVRDVFSSATPLVGAYSRFGWSHPGPFMFWAIAPFSKLFSDAPWATMVGAVLLQAAAVVWATVLAWRIGRLWFTVGTLAAIALAYSATGTEFFLEAWNPHVAFPFLAVFVLQLWLIAEGDRWQVLGGVVAASILVQTHVGYLPLVAAGALAVAVYAVIDRRLGGAFRPRWPRVMLWSAGTLFIVWLPPIVEALTDQPGNFVRMARYAFRGDGTPVGIVEGAQIIATEWAIPFPWLGGNDAPSAFNLSAEPSSLWWLLIPVGLVAVAVVVARA